MDKPDISEELEGLAQNLPATSPGIYFVLAFSWFYFIFCYC
jgi:hypothetical protein